MSHLGPPHLDMIYADFYDPNAAWRQAVVDNSHLHLQEPPASPSSPPGAQGQLSVRRPRLRLRQQPHDGESSSPFGQQEPHQLGCRSPAPGLAWPAMKTLSAGLARQYERGANTDVTLKCDGKEFQFYRVILAAYSDVFQAMFEHGDLRESREGLVQIEGCSAESLSLFLDLLVLGRPRKGAKVDAAAALELFAVADKYNVAALKAHFVPIIMRAVNRENCLQVLVAAFLHEHDALMETALRTLQDHKDAITKSDEWRTMVDTYPQLINNLLLKVL